MVARYQKHLEGHTDSLITKIMKDVAHAYDWLAGPAMTERDRIRRDVAESHPVTPTQSLI